MIKQYISLLLIVALITATPLSTAQAGQLGPGCYIRELVAAQDDDCPDCDPVDLCTGGAYVIPQYYQCQTAGSGEAGKCYCNYSFQVAGTWYPCENNWDVSEIIACVATTGICAAACTACIVDPTKITCGACVACLVYWAAECWQGWCGWIESCDKDTGAGQSIYRSVFQSLEGEACEG
ncbi:MAG: hypothetical protein ACYS1A_10700 [Planctomycetota bacterium]|jgi:hypothetical protein